MTIDTKALRELALLDVIEMKTPFPDEITLKTRAKNLLALRHAERGSDLARYQHGVIALLQEMVNEPEPEPVARVTGYYGGYLSIATVDGRVLPAGTALYAAPPHQSEHHLDMVKNAGIFAEVSPITSLPDGSAFFTASYPLPPDHWLYAEREYALGADEPKELPEPILTHQQRETVIAAIRYAVRGATMCGKEVHFDPDALVQNAVYALCGPFTKARAAEKGNKNG